MLKQQYSRLKVIGIDGRFALCLCDCGMEKRVRIDHLKSGATRSCGCLRSEITSKAKTTHGMYGTKENRAWLNMKDRCNNPNHDNYPHYGGRGITIFPEWNQSFQAFYDYIGDAPSARHTIDRIDTNGNYEPGNVRWATWAEQQVNRTDTEYIEIRGISLTPRQWCELADHKFSNYRSRVRRGCDKIEAIITPPIPPKQRRELRTADAQRLWLNKILSLAIEAGIVEVS